MGRFKCDGRGVSFWLIDEWICVYLLRSGRSGRKILYYGY